MVLGVVPCQDSAEKEENSGRRAMSIPAPLEDEDLLREIFLRLPPVPSTLSRASPCARAGAVSSLIPASSTVSADTSRNLLSWASSKGLVSDIPPSNPSWTRPTASPPKASLFGFFTA